MLFYPFSKMSSESIQARRKELFPAPPAHLKTEAQQRQWVADWYQVSLEELPALLKSLEPLMERK